MRSLALLSPKNEKSMKKKRCDLLVADNIQLTTTDH